MDFRFVTSNVKVFPPSLRVTVPEGYWDAGNTKQYPVLLLLHGGFGMFLDWTQRGGSVVDIARGHEVIIAMPDGGGGSFYSNANFPNRRIAGWEDCIIHQVLPFVHRNFRTKGGGHVGIAGLSMGGFGALALGHKYYGHFSTISSYSGPANTFDRAVDTIIYLGPAADTTGPLFDGRLLYPLTANSPGSTWGTNADLRSGLNRDDLRHQYNPLDHIERYRGKRLFVRAGTADPTDLFNMQKHLAGQVNVPSRIKNFIGDVQESVVLRTNRQFRDALTRAGIGVDYGEMAGQTHDWVNWNECLRQDLPGIVSRLQRPL